MANISEAAPDSLALSQDQCNGGARPERRHCRGRRLPVIRNEELQKTAPPECIREAQETIKWADHLLFCYPLWLGTLPALLKGFPEQTFRDGFTMRSVANGRGWKRLLTGKSARIVVTLGMPALAYRWYFGAHGLKSFERSIRAFAAIGPIRESLIGAVDSGSTGYRGRWLIRMPAFGRKARCKDSRGAAAIRCRRDRCERCRVIRFRLRALRRLWRTPGRSLKGFP